MFSQFRPTFAGFGQHDSLESFSSLLDLIHEDVNKVKKKQYIEHEDSSAENRAASRKAWGHHKLRNNSKVVGLFHGQVKSKIVCPTCNKTSVRWDSLSTLPLDTSMNKSKQSASITTTVILIRNCFVDVKISDSLVDNGKNSMHLMTASEATTFSVEVKRTARVGELKQQLATLCESDARRLVLLDIYCGRVYTHIEDQQLVTTIKKTDRVLAFELPENSKTTQWCHVVVQQRTIVSVYESNSVNSKEEENLQPNIIMESRALKNTDPMVVSFPKNATAEEFRIACLSQFATVVDTSSSPPFKDALRQNPGIDTVTRIKNLMEFVEDERAAVCIKVGDANFQKMSVVDAENNCLMALDVLPEQALLPDALRMQVDSNGKPRIYPPGCKLMALEFAEGQAPTKSVPTKLHDSYRRYVAKLNCKPNLTLAGLLEKLDVEEKLDADNMWYCNRCKEHKQATKRMAISMLPKILVIHLKRFKFRNAMYSDKITQFIDFPTEGLDMAPFLYCPPVEHHAHDQNIKEKNSQQDKQGQNKFDDAALDREIRDFEKELNKWRRDKLAKFDRNASFRSTRVAKYGDKAGYITFLDNKVALKMQDAVQDRKKRLQKAHIEFDGLVTRLIENADLSRVAATSQARNHFQQLGQDDVLNLVFDEERLERLNRERAAKAAAEADDDSVMVEVNGVSIQEPPCTVYDLFAVCNHFGSLYRGHYTATVRQISTTAEVDAGAPVDLSTDQSASNLCYGKWLHFDDSRPVREYAKVLLKCNTNSNLIGICLVSE